MIVYTITKLNLLVLKSIILLSTKLLVGGTCMMINIRFLHFFFIKIVYLNEYFSLITWLKKRLPKITPNLGILCIDLHLEIVYLKHCNLN